MCATQAPVPPATTSMPHAADTANPAQSGSASGAASVATSAATSGATSGWPSDDTSDVTSDSTSSPTSGATAAASPGGTATPADAPAAAAPSGAVPSQPPAPATQHAAAAIEAVADSLSGCADELHERIMRAIRQRPSGDAAGTGDDLAGGITQDAAQALFDQEVLLRQSANSLYVQAAALAVAGLDSVRQDLMEVTAAARDTLRRVAKVQALVGLAAGLVGLASAIAAGKPGQWPGAIRAVRDQLKGLHNDGQA